MGIGTLLRKLRNETGRIAEDVAASVGIRESYLTFYERDDRTPHKWELAKLAEFYDVDPVWLKKGDLAYGTQIYRNGRPNPHLAELIAVLRGAEGDNLGDENRELAAEVALATAKAVVRRESRVHGTATRRQL